MTAFFLNIPFLYLALYVSTVISCMYIGTRTSFVSALFLSALVYSGWDDSLWHNPGDMAAYHLVIVVLMVFLYQGPVGVRMAKITLCMAIADIFFFINNKPSMMSSYFPYGLFWWQSILTLLFLSQLFIVSKGCYNSLKLNRFKRRLGDGSFYASEAHSGSSR